MIFASKQEIRSEVANRIRGAVQLSEKELEREITRVTNLLTSHIPMHLNMLAKHIALSHDRKRIEEQTKIFELEVCYKLALMRYSEYLKDIANEKAYATK